MKFFLVTNLILIFISATAFAGGEAELDADGWRDYSHLKGFRSIDVRTNIEVTVTPGSDWSVRARGDTKDLDDLDLYVSGRNLIIRRESVFNFFDSGNLIEVNVTLPQLEKVVLSSDGSVRSSGQFESRNLELVLSGSGSIRMEALADSINIISSGSGDVDFSGRTDRLSYNGTGTGTATVDVVVNRTEIQLTGSGRIELIGETDLMNISSTGSGSIHADRMESRVTEVSIMGSGDVDVRAADKLEVNILGSGSLRYYGDPMKTEFRSLGTGKIRKG